MTFLDIYIESVVAIDTKPICLDPQDRVALKNLGEYLNRLAEVFKLFFYEMKNVMLIGKNVETFEFRSLFKIQTMFKDSCNYSLQGINLFHISLGFIVMMRDIVDIELNDIANLIDIVKNKTIKKDWGDVYKSNTKNINLDYFKYILNYLKQTKEENEDIFNWVQDMTLGLYNCEFKKNLKEIIEFEQKMKYEEPPVKPPEEKKTTPKEEEKVKEPEPDLINFKKEDNIKIINDVHNGIADLMPLDDGMVLEKRKREFKKVEIAKVPVTNVRPKKPPVVDTTSLDPHKKYTLEELKEKIKKDELKDTLKVKQKFNPDEAKDLEEKMIASGNEDLLKEEEKKTKAGLDKDAKSPSKKNTKTTLKKGTTVKQPSDKEEDDAATTKKNDNKTSTLKKSGTKSTIKKGSEEEQEDDKPVVKKGKTTTFKPSDEEKDTKVKPALKKNQSAKDSSGSGSEKKVNPLLKKR